MQNGIPVGLRSSPSFGLSRSGQLTAIIQSLFWDGSQGWWYDDNDLTTLFQDSAGTTPVTAVEQFVGLQLDKSRGLVLGPELVPATYSGVVGGLWAISATAVTRNGSSTNQASFNLTSTPTANKHYQVVFTVSDLSGDTLGFRLAGGTAYNITANGTYTFRIISGGTGGLTFIPWAGTAGQATITNISVRELPGNHRYAPASGNRPIWSKRVNLLTKTEQFDDAVRIKNVSSVSSNAAVAPNGTTTADKIIIDNGAVLGTSTGAGVRQQPSKPAASITFTESVYAKAAGFNSVMLFISNLSAAAGSRCTFNLVAGTFSSLVSFGSGFSGASASIEPVGDNWYRCVLTTTSDTDTTSRSAILPVDTVATQGDGTSGIFVWGADFRPANQATGTMPLYQRVNTSTDYETNGFPGYLKADGVDDFLQTNSINFTATDKITLCAGVRKLSDAARAMVTELGADVPQSFQFNAPSAAATTYSFASRGSAAASSAVYSNSAVAAPITNVATGIGDISGDSAILRINGTQVATSTTDQGTGNYGNLPAYFFHRNTSPATLRFNGYEYGNIAVGKLLTADQTVALETYMNGLTKAY